MSELFVGVDIGTEVLKAVAMDRDGTVCGGAERPTPWQHRGGQAEADPMSLVRLAETVAAEAALASRGTGDGADRVLAIGVTGMAETGVLVDSNDGPLAPAIAWFDPRGDVDTIVRELGTETFERTTGLPLTALPSLPKLLWLRRNHPETKGAVRFYSVGEWVVRGLGGDPVSELSLASRTGLLDLGAARPWDAALGLLDWPSLLPEPVMAGTAAGRAGDSVPAALQVAGDPVPSILRGAVLTVAGHDHQVAAYGVGAATDGALFDSLGTAEAFVRTILPPLTPERASALTTQGVSVGWGVVAGHLSVITGLPTGLTLNRIATMLGAVTRADRVALGEQALGAPDHPTLRLVNPRDEHFGIDGITDGVTPARLWRTAVDGMAVEARRLVARVDALVGPYQRVVVAGGWLRNPAVLAAKRRQYGAMSTAGVAEPGAYGAALLAASAAGISLPPALTYARYSSATER
jgi:sugar (pentulose or hexulose) kinase